MEPLFAALDLGTNNCRLLVARRAKKSGAPFVVVGSFSRITRLGEGLSETGSLNESAMSRTVDALSRCREVMDQHQVTRGRFIATEACRRATNCDAFLNKVEKRTGLKLEIISAQEEARLAVVGCASLMDPDIPYSLVFDVGGGSSEVIWARRGTDGAVKVEGFISLPLGVVTVTEDCGGVVCETEYPKVKAHVMARLRGFEEKHGIVAHIHQGHVQMVGTSGTITTLAAAALDLPRYRRSAIDGLSLDFDRLREARDRLVSMTHTERAANPCIGDGRADLVVAGCAILEAICDLWPVGRLTVADRGLREGLLLELMDT